MQKINEYARVFAAVREEKVARVYLRLYNTDLVLPSEMRIYRIKPTIKQRKGLVSICKQGPKDPRYTHMQWSKTLI